MQVRVPSMKSLLLNSLGFIGGSALIFWGGIRLSLYGDQLASMLGWGRMFMGMVLIAGITSLPELLSGISSVVIMEAPDLAVAESLGIVMLSTVGLGWLNLDCLAG